MVYALHDVQSGVPKSNFLSANASPPLPEIVSSKNSAADSVDLATIKKDKGYVRKIIEEAKL